MKINSYHRTDSLSFPLPLHHSICIGEAIWNEEGRFFIFAGLDERLVTELKRLSQDTRDTELRKHTSDRARFGKGAYEEWYAKGRTPFALIEQKTGALAALAWLGPKAMPAGSAPPLPNQQTLAYRCYPKFRGRGLMKDFVNFVITTYLASVPNATLWTEVNTENTASSALAEKLGFKTIKTKETERKKIIMIRG